MQAKSWVVCSSMLFLCTAAHGQSSVTLYGLLDEGVNFTNNAGGTSAVQMRSGDVYGSRFGLKGDEDLGGGYHAIFKLENGFNPNNGALSENGRIFGRQAFVGLSSDRLGTVTLGRQYDPTVDMFSGLTAAGNWAGDVGAVPFDSDNADLDFRVNNSIKYVSPTFAGFSGEAMYAFSNTAGGFATNRVVSAAGQYQKGGWTAAVGYMRIDQPGVGSSGAVTSDSIFTGAMQENIDAGVGYKFDKAMLAFAYSHARVDDPTGNEYLSGSITPANGGTWTSWQFDNFQVNGQYFFRPDFWLGASYTYTLGKLDSTAGDYSPKWHSVALMLDYDVSKRTSLYVQAAYQHVQSANTGTQFDNAQFEASAGPSSTENQVVTRAAIIHRF
jgi:predicted porin